MTDITVDHFFAHPPAKVWAALTDPALLARWLMPNDFTPVVGHRFTFHTTPQPAHGFDGVVHCQVLAVEPLRRLRISWRGGTLDTTVTWTLAAEGHGTRLLIEHAGFDPDDPAQQRIASTLGQGWRSHLVRSLGAVLDATATRGTR